MRVPSLKQVRLELAARSLSDFIRLYWRCIDPTPYIRNWHIEEICDHLQAVSTGEIRRLLITMPPRRRKSISVAAGLRGAGAPVSDDRVAEMVFNTGLRTTAMSAAQLLASALRADVDEDDVAGEAEPEDALGESEAAEG